MNSFEWTSSGTARSRFEEICGDDSIKEQIVKIENNNVNEMISIYEGFMGVKYAGQIDSIVRDLVFNDKYDGCYDRPEYYVFEHYSKGTSFNCLTIRHIDTQRELYNPDDPDTSITTSKRKYLTTLSLSIF